MSGRTIHDVPSADGYVALSIAPVAQVSEALGGVPALAGLEDPAVAFSRRDEIRAALAPVLERQPTAELRARLRARGGWCAPVSDPDGALTDPAVQHLDPVLELGGGPDGARVLRHPVRYGAGEPELRHPPPALGEHTEEILRELGL